MCNLEKDLQVGGVLGNEKGALGGEGTSGGHGWGDLTIVPYMYV